VTNNIFSLGDTSGEMANFLLVYLSMYPECQKKLRDEITEYMERNQVKRADELTLDQVEEMEFLEMCVNEVVRLRGPGVISFPRIVNKDLPLGKYMIPKGSYLKLPLVVQQTTDHFWKDGN
jgi:cytochrome P450